MTEDRLPLAELLAKAGDGDFLRSVAEAVVQLLMETDVEGSDRRRPARAVRRPHDLPQRLPGPDAGHAPGQPAAAHPEAAAGQLLPALPRAAQDVGEGPGGGDPGSLGQRRLDPAGRRPGAGDGAGRDLQEHGLQAVQGHRRSRRRLPRPPARRRVALSLAGRDLPQAARGRPHRLGRGDNRRGREHRGQAGDRRPAHRADRRPRRSGPRSSRAWPAAACAA